MTPCSIMHDFLQLIGLYNVRKKDKSDGRATR